MNILKFTGTTLLLSGAFFLTACSSDDGGGGIPAATAPTNAIVLDAANSETTLNKVLDTSSALPKNSSSTSNKATPTSIINQRIDNIRNNSLNSGVDLVSGVAFTETYDCATDFLIDSSLEGTSNTYTATGNAGLTSASGTITFVSCTDTVSGITLNGTINFSSSIGSNASADLIITTSTSGSFTATPAVGGDIAISNYAYTATFNFTDFTMVISKMQYTYDPVTGNGFAVNMTTNVEASAFDCGPTAGVIIISGASNSGLRITYNIDESITVELDTGDGIYTEIAISPIACTP